MNPVHARTAIVVIPSGIAFPSRTTQAEHWALFLSYLSLLTSLTKERQRQRHGHYINIHSGILKSLLGGRYHKVIDELVDAGIIETNDSYCADSSRSASGATFTKSYRLTAAFRTGTFSQFELATKPSLKKAIKQFQPDPGNLGPAGMHYYHQFHSFEMLPAAATDLQQSDHWDQWAVARWLNRQGFSIRCDHRRYHCLATQLPKELRSYIRADSSPVSIVDVSACQPLLLGLAAATIPPNICATYDSTDLSGCLLTTAVTDRRVASDVCHWIKLCESRDIYDYLYDAIQRSPDSTLTTIRLSAGNDIEIDLKSSKRPKFKEATLILLFDRVPAMMQSPMFKIIQRDFPTISGFILAAKAQRHQALACLLQRLESELMIDGLGNRLRNDYPNEPIQPIHDALMVKDAFAPTAKGLIVEQFARLGVQPTVKQETCGARVGD